MWNSKHETPVLDQLGGHRLASRQGKERSPPAALTLVRPVKLEPQTETKVLVTTRTTGPCLISGRKDYLAGHRLYMTNGYHRKVARHTLFAVMVVHVARHR